MKRMGILALIATAAVLTGCVQLESDVVLNKDGSGTCHLQYSMSLEVEDALRQMMTMNSDMTKEMGDMKLFDEDFDTEGMKKDLEPLGVKVKGYESVKEDGKRVVNVDFSFADAEGLQAVLQFTGGGESTLGVRKLEDGNYALMKVESLAVLDDKKASEEEAAPNMDDIGAAMENAGKSMELMGTLMSSIQDLNIVSKITFPGKILKQNAHRVEGNTCIWEFNSDNMNQLEGMDEPYIVFSGDGLSLDVPDK